MTVLIVEVVLFTVLCYTYWHLFGRVKASNKLKMAEIISLYAAFFISGLAKNIKLSLLILTIFIIGIGKKIAAKNERKHSRMDI